MRNRLSFLVIMALAGLMVSCSRSVEPGLYHFRSGTEDGFLRVGLDSLGREEAVFYRNAGSLWADTTHLVLDGKKLSLKPYEVPEFRMFSDRDLYLNPLFAVGETQDIVYGRVVRNTSSDRETEDLMLDVYYPRNDRADLRPLMVMLHGGGFEDGDKRDTTVVEWCRHFASLGYVVSSVNYRQGYRRTVESTDDALYRALKDANASVRFLLKRDSLLIDRERIFASGMDAGAITALNLAFMREENLPEVIQENEDTTVVVHQPLMRGFDVRAVANLWGAVTDTSILHNAAIPVISFQSRNDPVVPYGEGYPYDGPVEEDTDFFRAALEALLSIFLPDAHPFRKMFGAGIIDRILKSGHVSSELHAYDAERHDLFYLDDGTIDYPFFDSVKEMTARFFSSRMETSPVSLRQDPEDLQVFVINDTEVQTCLWKVEGGVILGKSSDTIRVLLFPDASEHSVSVSGVYSSGLTFFETVDL